jgi:predicted negative regulator of RcsB-dependent stress response
MVDEFLSEREQAEQLRNWLRENWIWLVAGVALTIGGYYGWRAWQSHQSSRAVEAGQLLASMLEAIGGDRREEGLRLAGQLTGDYADTPYADHATLVLARLDVDAGDFVAAERRLAGVAEGSNDPDLRVVARVRLARVQLAQGRASSSCAATSVMPRATRRRRSGPGARRARPQRPIPRPRRRWTWNFSASRSTNRARPRRRSRTWR